MKSKELPAYCHPDQALKPEGVAVYYFSSPEGFDLTHCRRFMMDLNRPVDQREWYSIDTPPAWVSAHLFIGRGGEIWKLIDFGKKARPESDLLNVYLIGTQESGTTDEQQEALNSWLEEAKNEWGFDQVVSQPAGCRPPCALTD